MLDSNGEKIASGRGRRSSQPAYEKKKKKEGAPSGKNHSAKHSTVRDSIVKRERRLSAKGSGKLPLLLTEGFAEIGEKKRQEERLREKTPLNHRIRSTSRRRNEIHVAAWREGGGGPRRGPQTRVN